MFGILHEHCSYEVYICAIFSFMFGILHKHCSYEAYICALYSCLNVHTWRAESTLTTTQGSLSTLQRLQMTDSVPIHMIVRNIHMIDSVAIHMIAKATND